MNAIDSSGPGAFESHDAFQEMLSGRIEPVRVALPYQIGLIIVACAMVMLPVLYVGLIAATGYAVYSHGLSPEWIAGDVPSGRISFILYFGPIVMGVIMIVFMLKPLFSRASSEKETLSIDAENEPRLYDFVSHVCRFVGAPVPREIEVSLDVNASAGFKGGLMSMFRANDLSLHIGLPLVAGIDLNQLTGVLAHEFGHFSQGTAMRMTYVIRSINAWFARVVYERDGLDDAIEEQSKNQGALLMLILVGARAMIFAARQLLKVLMYAGAAISCYMMRQMEYDADLYGVRVIGNTEYDKLSERFMLLSMAADKTGSDLSRVYMEGRLVDDIPGLIVANECGIPDELRLRARRQIMFEESSLFDTHPSPSERLASTNKERCDGAINLDLPATSLFSDFEEVCRLTTRAHYQLSIATDPSEIELISVAEVMEQEGELKSGEEATGRYFGAMPSIDLLAMMTGLSPDPSTSVADLRKLMKEIQEYMDAAAAPVGEIIARNDQEPDDGAKATVHGYFQKASQRMLTVFRLLDACEFEDNSGPRYQAPQQVSSLLPSFMELAMQASPMLAIHENIGTLATHFENLAKNDQDIRLFNAMSASFEELKKRIRTVTDALSVHDYPFSHAFDAVSLADYIFPSQPDEADFLGYHGAAEDLVYAYTGVVYRVLGVLSRAAIDAEAILELGPPPDVFESISGDDALSLPAVENEVSAALAS